MAAAKPQLNGRAKAARRGLAAVVVAVAAAAAGCGGAGTPREASPPPSDPRAAMPAAVQRYVHETFHRLPGSCARGRADRRQLDRTTARFIELYRRYPADRFRMRIDDESGTTLSAILVLRDELARCSPRHAARIDPILPPTVRRALRRLPPAAG